MFIVLFKMGVAKSHVKPLIAITLISLSLTSIFSELSIRREVDDVDFSTLHEILLKELTSFSVSSFKSDPELVQQVDKINRTTSYKSDVEDVSLYERSEDDSKKDVVVLTEQDDKIHFRKVKRGYVVLKKNPRGSTYFGEFVFVRPAFSENDLNIRIIDGGPSLLEWIPFDDHWIRGKVSIQQLALSCASSVLSSCLFNGNVLTAKGKYMSSSDRFVPKSPLQASIKNVEALVWKTHDGSDPEENHDYYSDIELAPIKGGNNISKITQSVGRTVQNILCLAAPPTCTLNGTLTPGILQIVDSKKDVVVGRRKRETTKSASNYPGWKTQYIKAVPGSYLLDHKSVKFFGFGNCPFDSNLDYDSLFTNAKSVHDYIQFYLKILRVNCITTMNLFLEEIVKSGVLKSVDKTFDVMSDHKYLTQAKLTRTELVHLVAAFEFSIFTANYKSIVFNSQNNATAEIIPMSNHTTPTGKPRSKSITFLVTLVLDYLKSVREKAPLHMIHLTRCVLQNTQTMLFKLAEDNFNLVQNCVVKDCEKDKIVNFYDRVQLMALNQFIRRGLGPVEKGTVDMDDAFIQFYKDNELILEKFVEVYT